MSLSFPTVSFGTLERFGAKQICIVIDAEKLSQRAADALAQDLRAKNLECLEAQNGNEYAQTFFLSRGIVVFAKKHDPLDADHSRGMDLGVTVKEAFERIKEIFQQRYQQVQVHPLAHEKLQEFLTPFQSMGFEAAQAVMPELQGIESVLEEVKPQKQQTQKPKSRWHWLSGAFVILAFAYVIRLVFTKNN